VTADRCGPSEDWQTAPCGLAVLDAQGLVRRANATFCLWLGVAENDLAGLRTFSDLLTVGGRIFYQTHVLPLVRIQGSVAELKLDMRTHDAGILPMLANLRVREDGGMAVAVFIAKDRVSYERELLRARRQAEDALARQTQAQRALDWAEQSLRLALEAARVGIWRIDPAGMRRFSDSMALLLGEAQPSPVDEARFVASLHPDDRGVERALIGVQPSPGQGPVRQVYRMRGVDGVERVVEACGQALFDEAGEFLEMLGVVYDVTDLTRRGAEAEDRALLAEQMIGIVSHDLRNPLTAVLAGLGIFTDLSLTDRQQRVCEHMHAAVQRAVRLIRDLLDFTAARLGAGLRINRQRVDTHELLDQALCELRLSFPDQPLLGTFRGPREFVVDPDRLVQLLGNLVANAVHYGAVGRPVRITSDTGAVLKLAVHNEGIPIPAAQQERLFDAMVRGSTHHQTEGVGLGLFIVRAIVRAHGGDVSVHSTEDMGTCFTATFAAAAPDELHG
jgi:sigma-B regulation protein RsbU (phosphoserine phosphatase)